jgi:hypothetical protein
MSCEADGSEAARLSLKTTPDCTVGCRERP